jgi:hypothetical protein
MDETLVFEEGNVKVTSARFVVDGQTYAMNGVTSVRQFEKKPNRVLPIVVGLAGLPGFAGHWLLGLILFGAAFAIWTLMKTEYSVLLSTAGGEARALSSKDRSYIVKVVEALNEAIIKRG